MNPILPIHPDAEARLRMLESAIARGESRAESQEPSELWRGLEDQDGSSNPKTAECGPVS